MTRADRPLVVYPLPASPALRVLSLGAGVQSSVMALMAATGEIGPRPDVMIFADTQWEPGSVYNHLDWLENEVTRLTNGQMPLHRVTAGDIRGDALTPKSYGREALPPYFTEGGGFTRRQCTSTYKIEPIRAKVRELLGIAKGARVPKGVEIETWHGISLDELERVKRSPMKWETTRYPLIEMRMTRDHCKAWFADRYPGRTLAKSACIGCPYHNNAAWRDLRDRSPEEWADAVDFDRRIRERGYRSLRATPYLHRDLKPLDEVDLSDGDERQMSFLDECEGMCGV